MIFGPLALGLLGLWSSESLGLWFFGLGLRFLLVGSLVLRFEI